MERIPALLSTSCPLPCAALDCSSMPDAFVWYVPFPTARVCSCCEASWLLPPLMVERFQDSDPCQDCVSPPGAAACISTVLIKLHGCDGG